MWSTLHVILRLSGHVLSSFLQEESAIHNDTPDFGATAATFQATALRVQNLLSEITPDTPEANLPVEFNSWLRGLISTYPGGCTYADSFSKWLRTPLTSCRSRATNVFNFYVARMNTVSANTGVNPVPACFPLYHAAAGVRLLHPVLALGRY